MKFEETRKFHAHCS